MYDVISKLRISLKVRSDEQSTANIPRTSDIKWHFNAVSSVCKLVTKMLIYCGINSHTFLALQHREDQNKHFIP